MIELLRCEYMKIKGRYIFVTALIITAVQLCWVLYGNYNDKFIMENGWMMFLYQLPLANAIFLPILSIVVSSRLCDIEHKGSVFKQLAVMSDRGRIYDAKFIFGLIILIICIFISWAAIIIFGNIQGFQGVIPLTLYLLYLVFTIVPTTVIYVFQHILSIIFKNQAVTFFAGIIGTFCGLFSMFLQNVPFLRRALLWGYYGVLQFVGLFGWTKEKRYREAYFEIMEIDWSAFGILIAAGVVMYAVGRYIFYRKEI